MILREPAMQFTLETAAELKSMPRHTVFVASNGILGVKLTQKCVVVGHDGLFDAEQFTYPVNTLYVPPGEAGDA